MDKALHGIPGVSLKTGFGPGENRGIISFVDSIYEYKDYRDLLRDAYLDRKERNSHVSYRMMGRILDVDASFLVKVMRAEVHLGESSLSGMAKFLKLDERGGKFLESLYRYSRARGAADMKIHYEEMMRIKGVEAQSVKRAQYSFYEKWHHTVVWAMLHCAPDRSAQWYADTMRPRLEVRQVEESLELLRELGFLASDEQGRMVLHARHLESGDPLIKPAVRSFHDQMIGLASRSLESFAPELRDVSGITVAVDKDCLEDVREIVRDARKKIQGRVDEVDVPDRVAQINFQVFPLTEVME